MHNDHVRYWPRREASIRLTHVDKTRACVWWEISACQN